MGVPFLPAAERKVRLAEFVEIVRALLDGETVDHHGGTSTSRQPRPGQAPPARRGADPRRRQRHQPARPRRHATPTSSGSPASDARSPTATATRCASNRRSSTPRSPSCAAAAGRRPVELNVLVQVVEVTDDRQAAAADGWPPTSTGSPSPTPWPRRSSPSAPTTRSPSTCDAVGAALGHRLRRRARRRAFAPGHRTVCVRTPDAQRRPTLRSGRRHTSLTISCVGRHRLRRRAHRVVTSTPVSSVGVIVVVIVAASSEGGDRQGCTCDRGQRLHAHSSRVLSRCRPLRQRYPRDVTQTTCFGDRDAGHVGVAAASGRTGSPISMRSRPVDRLPERLQRVHRAGAAAHANERNRRRPTRRPSAPPATGSPAHG